MRAAAAAGAGPAAWRPAGGTAQGWPWALASGGGVNLGSDKKELNGMLWVKPARPVEGQGGYASSSGRKEKHIAPRLFWQP